MNINAIERMMLSMIDHKTCKIGE